MASGSRILVGVWGYWPVGDHLVWSFCAVFSLSRSCWIRIPSSICVFLVYNIADQQLTKLPAERKSISFFLTQATKLLFFSKQLVRQ